MKLIGNKSDVIAGRALKTTGGLTKSDFVQKPDGKWVYKAKSRAAKKRWNNDQGLRSIFNVSRAQPFEKRM